MNKTVLNPATARIETLRDVSALIRFFVDILGAAFHPETPVNEYICTDEEGNTRPSFAPAVADKLQDLLNKAFEICEAENVDICAIGLSYALAALHGLNLDKLNRDFLVLLEKHENDSEVTGASREKFAEVTEDEADPDIITFWAMACNAWDELCTNNEGLENSGLNWYCGATSTPYANEYDLYIGNGDEPSI